MAKQRSAHSSKKNDKGRAKQSKVAKATADEDTYESDSEIEEEKKNEETVQSSSHRVSMASSWPIYCKDIPRLDIKFSTKRASFHYRALPNT